MTDAEYLGLIQTVRAATQALAAAQAAEPGIALRNGIHVVLIFATMGVDDPRVFGGCHFAAPMDFAGWVIRGTLEKNGVGELLKKYIVIHDAVFEALPSERPSLN